MREAVCLLVLLSGCASHRVAISVRVVDSQPVLSVSLDPTGACHVPEWRCSDEVHCYVR
jgi:hypothetical protein